MPRDLMIEDELAVRLPNHQILSTPVLLDAVKFYAHHGSIVKGKIDGLAVDIRECHEKIKNAHAIIQALNNLAADDGSVNLNGHEDIKQLLQIAKDSGVNIPMKGEGIKTEFTYVQRDRLIENLHLSADEWDKETKNYSQKMQVHMQESERYLMLANQVLKYENQPKKSAIAGIKGA
jgi:hypothetical protein